jgi:hypothetical protein
MNFFYKAFAVFVVLILTAGVTQAQLNTLKKAQTTLTSAENIVSQTSVIVDKINAAVLKVEGSNLYKSLVDGKEFTFPVAILPGSGDRKYALIINKVFVTTDGMFAEVFMKVPIPGGADRALYFVADKVPFSRPGGIAGEMRLYLARTDSIKVGDGYAVVFNGLEKGGIENSCFATFTCKGYKDIQLTGEVNFDKKAIVKSVETKEQVSIKYQVKAAKKVSNFTIELSDIPTFEFANLPGFKCTVPTIVLDNSEVENTRYELPAWYSTLLSTQSGQTLGVEWEGIYIPTIKIDIPKSFKEKDPNQVVVIEAKDLIVDHAGVTVKASARGATADANLYEGKIKSWEYSIKSLGIELTTNALSGASIEGAIALPISKQTSKIGFGLTISKTGDDLSYIGSIEKDVNVEANAFGLAKIHLTHTKLNFEYTNKQFYPSVELTGDLTICSSKDTSSNTDKKSFASFGLEFVKLQLSTKGPNYIDIAGDGYIKMSPLPSAMSNFPVSIKSVAFIKKNGGQGIGIKLDLVVKLQKSGGNAFVGEAVFTIWAKRNPSTEKWQYDRFQLNTIIVDFSNSSIALHGELSTFDDDPLYGTGVCGYIDLKIMKKIEIKVSAIFGKKGATPIDLNNPPPPELIAENNKVFRYWFVDAAVNFPVITVGPFIGINGFTGGVYQNMHLEREPKKGEPKSTVDCKTASGMRYVPDDRVALGLLAGIGLQSVPTDAVFNGTITFGIEFARAGGVLMVALYGDVTLLTPPAVPPSASKMTEGMSADSTKSLDDQKASAKTEKPKESAGMLRVKWFTQYNVPEETFIGDFDIYVNVAGVVTGALDPATHHAGHIAVMFSPKAKYVYMGTPLQPMGVEVIKLFKCTTYFCAGNTLPSPPIAPLPPEVHVSEPFNYAAMESGAGLSFGARVEIGGKFDASVDVAICKVDFYAELWLKAGFDVTISKTNVPVYCSNQSDARGINNWYATGQAFIAGGMKIGLGYRCKGGVSGNADLLSASMSAYLFAQLPNPSYMKGEVHAELHVWKFSGGADFKVKFGEQCEKPEDDKNVVFISYILPDSGSTDVKVTSYMTVAFLKGIGEDQFKFNLPNESGGGSVQYWASVDASNISLTYKGTELPFALMWSSDKTSLRITPLSVLPEAADIKLIVSVTLKNSNGGAITKEKKGITFRTAKEPDAIEPSNVAYSYPLPNMENYYRMESNSGYIKFFTLPNKPMKLVGNYSYQVVFEESGKEVARATDVKVDNRTGVTVEQFVFTIPNDKLSDGKSYTLKLIKSPLIVQEKDKLGQDGYTVGNVAEKSKDSTILEYTFKSSKFSSFSQKIAYYNQSQTEMAGLVVAQTLTPNVKDISSGKAEGFSGFETDGFRSGQIKTAQAMVRAIGADFSNGFVINGAVPDSVSYSFYGDKLIVLYKVFDEIHERNTKSNLQDIVCSISSDQTQSSCGVGSGKSTFPKATYFYKLGYYLPGRVNAKTSEVSLSFNLPKEVTF